jgi:GT2 family glycosyltransferase
VVTAVILNTNKRDDTLACLASLARQTYAPLRILVLDNASSDGSPEAVRRLYPQATLLPLTDNRGYAGNNNVGIAAAMADGSDWILVLNEDTEMAPDCVAQLVGEGERDARVGIVGPMVYHHDEPTVIQSAGGILGGPAWDSVHSGQNEADVGQFPAAREVQWISGCAIMVRRAVVEAVGAIDERFFYYWEETEWCVRAGAAGWRIRHVPAARLWHKGVQRNYTPAPSISYYATRNRLLCLSLHAPARVRAAAWWQMGKTVASWTLKPKWKDKAAHRDAMVRGARDFLAGRWGRMPQA